MKLKQVQELPLKKRQVIFWVIMSIIAIILFVIYLYA